MDPSRIWNVVRAWRRSYALLAVAGVLTTWLLGAGVYTFVNRLATDGTQASVASDQRTVPATLGAAPGDGEQIADPIVVTPIPVPSIPRMGPAVSSPNPTTNQVSAPVVLPSVAPLPPPATEPAVTSPPVDQSEAGANFEISCSLDSQVEGVPQGMKANFACMTFFRSDYNGKVNLRLVDPSGKFSFSMPADISRDPTQPPGPFAGMTGMTGFNVLIDTANLAPGDYPFTVIGTAGSFSYPASATLKALPADSNPPECATGGMPPLCSSPTQPSPTPTP
jgi:hypothetical protein